MGTTMTVALVEGMSVVIGHVGDSRAYLVRGDSMEQLTEDHSLVNELVKSGKISEEESRIHPQRSVITRAVGTDPDVDVDAFTIEAEDGDVFLICSDGLSDMVEDVDILELVDANRRTERLAVTRDRYRVDILIVQIGSSTEVQSGCVCRNVSSSLQVEISALYVVRDEFTFLRVDVRTQVRRRLPPEVIVRVVAARHPDVDAAVPAGTGAMKKQQVAIRGKRRSPVLGGTVDDCQIEGLLPGTIGTLTLGDPDVGKALPARLPPGNEVETESVG